MSQDARVLDSGERAGRSSILKSGGSGKVVKNPQQAIAIALSEAKVKPKKGMK